MERRTAVSSVTCLILFTILLICCTDTVYAEDSDFDISEGTIWSFDYLDGNSMESNGNDSASDGDYVRITIPVYNSNISSDNSSWKFSFGYGGQWYTGNTGILNGNRSISDVEISFGPLDEGIILCKLEIINSSESEISEIRVGPNPINFTSAGDANLVLLGQPAHVGDELTASILVHNQGEYLNSVRLELSRDDGTIIVLGDSVSISPGSSREVSADFIALIPGSQDIQWEILSSNGGVDISLNGTSVLDIQESQDIVTNIDNITWTLESGLELDFSVSLSSGLNRTVVISLFLKSGNDYSLFQVINSDLNPGIRDLNFKLGHPDASRLKISVSPNTWISLNGDAEEIIELSPPKINPSIRIINISPDIASVGDTISINYVLENNGNSRSSAGILRVVGIANDEIVFSQHSTPKIDAGNSFSGTIEITSWKYSQTTDINFIWTMDELTASNQTTIVVDAGTSTSLSVPFNINAAIYGALSGLAIVMTLLVIMRVVSQRTPSTEASWRGKKSSESRISRSGNLDEKIEIQCPGCSQRLNIPSNHEGSVKCPACTMLFKPLLKNENKIESSSDIISNRDDENTPDLPLESYSDNDLLRCPQCEQTLKVSLDKRPIKSRCPACRAEFIAKKG